MPPRLALMVLVLGLALAASGEVAIEQPGRVETLPSPLPPHWVFVGDPLLRRLALVDLEDGRLRGMVSTGYGLPGALFSPVRPELYVPETFYSRGSRGERTDVLTIYDATSLAPVAEVSLPPKRALNAVPVVNEALSDDGRFAAIFNMTPATSLSIVDLAERRFAGEITTPGCSLAYAAGERRFAMLCMDGALLLVRLDEEGKEAGKLRSPPFFDPEVDPVAEKGVRWRDLWLFVSFAGVVHPVDVSEETPRFLPTWPLVEESAGEDSWRPGGSQPLAVHQASGRLYALMHEGGPDTHKDPGSELWVFDLESHERLQRIELESPGFTYLGVPMVFGEDWVWPFNRTSDGLLAVLPSPGIDSVSVTQDEAPRLFTSGMFSGGVASYDALTGEFLGRVYTGNLGNAVLEVPTALGTGQ
ncbi:MAG: amine dehydrogenase large subunit [Myxococcota bacterium]